MLTAVFAPKSELFLAIGWALMTLTFNMGLKIAAAAAVLSRPAGPDRGHPLPKRLPVVTLLVPLYKEREIAGHLLRRLSVLDYPASLLDVILLFGGRRSSDPRDTVGGETAAMDAGNHCAQRHDQDQA